MLHCMHLQAHTNCKKSSFCEWYSLWWNNVYFSGCSEDTSISQLQYWAAVVPHAKYFDSTCECLNPYFSSPKHQWRGWTVFLIIMLFFPMLEYGQTHRDRDQLINRLCSDQTLGVQLQFQHAWQLETKGYNYDLWVQHGVPPDPNVPNKPQAQDSYKAQTLLKTKSVNQYRSGSH